MKSKVARVTLYASGAVVTRRLSVADSDAEVCLEGLPVELADDSVRVVCPAGTRAIEQASVRFAVAAREDEAKPALEDALAELRLARALADRRHETLQSAAAQLAELKLRRRMGPEDGIPAAKSPTRSRLQWLGLQAQQLRRLQDDLADAREECRLATERLATATAEAEAESSARQARTDEARKRIEISVAAGGEADVEVSYRVARCRWAPSYVLRIRDGEDAVLEMRAFIAQQTGEDWSEAAISVSTASTMQWVELPEVKALKVGRRAPPAVRFGWRPAPEDTDALYSDFDRVHERGPAPPPRTSAPKAPGVVLGSLDPTHVRTPTRKKQTVAGAPRSAAPAVAPMAAAVDGAVIRRRSARASFGAGAPGAGGPTDTLSLDEGAAAAEDDVQYELAPEAPMVGAAEPAGDPAELSVSRQLMDYGALRMSGPESATRGTLRRERAPAIAARPAMVAPRGHRWLPQRAKYDYTYDADGHHSIPSDGAPHLVAVLEAMPSLDQRYVCVPGQSTDVYRVCAARNPLDAPLPEGPLDVYQNGQFSLTTPLEAVAPGGRFELGLGVEQGIKVARRVDFEEDTEGLLKRQHAFEHHVNVEVQNLLQHEVSLEVRERIPVAARRDDPDVEVAERRVEPLWDPFDPAGEELKGGRRWKLTVAPQERTTLSARWVVRVPRGRELVGGNRRAR